jgi:transcriptional regulator with XRE-family HTH domain
VIRDLPPERGSPVIEQSIAKQVEDNFAAALRQSRENAGLSQSRLAARAGYDHSYVSRLESDTRAPTRDAVLSLGNAMGLAEVERDYLLAAAGFLPLRVENLLSSEPVVSEVYAVLNDGTLPGDVREDLRSAIRMALRQAQRAVSGWSSSPVLSSSANAD